MNSCILPKRQRVPELEPAAHIQAKRYKMRLHVSCSAKLINFNRYCELKLYTDFKAKHLKRQEQVFSRTLKMLRDASYGHGARAPARQHGSSAGRAEPARAPQGSAVVQGDQMYAADENK